MLSARAPYSLKRKPQRFWAGSITDAADGCGWARETVTNPKGVQSEAGLLQLAVPQLRAIEERFHPKLVERLGNRSVGFGGLVRGMDVRGLSTQDMEDLHGESFGKSRVSKSTVSRNTCAWLEARKTCWMSRFICLCITGACLDRTVSRSLSGGDGVFGREECVTYLRFPFVFAFELPIGWSGLSAELFPTAGICRLSNVCFFFSSPYSRINLVS